MEICYSAKQRWFAEPLCVNKLRARLPPRGGRPGAQTPLLGWPVFGFTVELASLPTTLLVGTICPARPGRNQGRGGMPGSLPVALPKRHPHSPRVKSEGG